MRGPLLPSASATFALALLALLAGCGRDTYIAGEPAPSAPRVDETADAVTLTTAAATLTVAKHPCRIELAAAGGRELTGEARPTQLLTAGDSMAIGDFTSLRRIDGGAEIDCLSSGGGVTLQVVSLDDRAIAVRIRPPAETAADEVRITLRAVAAEHLYGLTERIVDDGLSSELVPAEVGGLDRRGETVSMLVAPTIALYTPFFHSSNGYGVYVEGTMPGRYDLARTDPTQIAMQFELSPTTGTFGVVYFVGDHYQIMDEYTRLTGRPFLPPRWGFLHWRWRDEHRIGMAELDGVTLNADLVDDLTHYESLGIPAGNYTIDRPWTTGKPPPGREGFASFTFDPQRFPNADQMIQILQGRGYHLFLFIAPWAVGDNAVDAQRFGYYAPGSPEIIDYTNPEAVAWWSEHIRNLARRGVHGLKLDRSEEAIPSQVTEIWADGRNGREVHNDYPVIYARVHAQAMSGVLGADFLDYLRAGYAGSQQYGVFWGGDITGSDLLGSGPGTDLGLRAAIIALSRVAFMGFPIWGSDTGGYYSFKNRDVFARWLEFSAFCPIMEIGGTGSHAPWDMPTEPHFDAEMIDIYRRFVTWHHELVPLLYSLAVDAHASGRPMARPLVFDYPGDPNVADLWDEFLLGRDLLVAPIWRIGERERDVYLPAGEWLDARDASARVLGPTTVTAGAGLGEIPLYIRRGAILPLDVRSDVLGHGSAASTGFLTLDLYPAGAASSLSLHGENGDVRIELRPYGSDLELEVSPASRGVIARLRLDSAPETVQAAGIALAEVAGAKGLDEVSEGWYFDEAGGRLWIKVGASEAARVTVRQPA